MAGEDILTFGESSGKQALSANTSKNIQLSKDYPFLRVVTDGADRISIQHETAVGVAVQDATDTFAMPAAPGSIWFRSPGGGNSLIRVISPGTPNVWLEGWSER